MSSTGLINFIKITKRELKTLGSPLNPLSYIKYYKRWKKYLNGNQNPLEDELPWMNFPAIDFLDKIANPSFKVFEYGSGGSTFFWSKRVLEVFSVEHDKGWADNVTNALKQKNKRNATVFFIPPVKDDKFQLKNVEDPEDYISSDEASSSHNYENYVKKINDFPDDSFEIVVVDGRARPSCMLTAKSKVKPGGYLVVDNTEREYYLKNTWPILQNENWMQLDFIGPVPYLEHFCKTSIFQKIS